MSKLLLTTATAIALVAAPTIAAAQTVPATAEVQPASERVTGSAMDGDMTYVWIGLGVVALILLFILLDDDDDEDDELPISP